MKTGIFVKTVSSILIVSSISFAQEKPTITPLQKGQQAPYAGVLLNDAAVADTVAQAEAQEKKLDAAVETCLKEEKIKCDYALNVQKIDSGADKKAMEARINALLSSNESLNKRIVQAETTALSANKNNTFWFAGGLVGGVVLGVLTTYFVVKK